MAVTLLSAEGITLGGFGFARDKGPRFGSTQLANSKTVREIINPANNLFILLEPCFETFTVREFDYFLMGTHATNNDHVFLNNPE